MGNRLGFEGDVEGVHYQICCRKNRSGEASSYLKLKEGERSTSFRVKIKFGNQDAGHSGRLSSHQKQKIEGIVCDLAKRWKAQDQVGKSKRINFSTGSTTDSHLNPLYKITCSDEEGVSTQVSSSIDISPKRLQQQAAKTNQCAQEVSRSRTEKPSTSQPLSEKNVVPLPSSERIRRVFVSALDNERTRVSNRAMTYFHSYKGRVYGSEKVTFLPALDQYEGVLYRYLSKPSLRSASTEENNAKRTLIYQKLAILTLEKLRRVNDRDNRRKLIDNFFLFYSHACHQIPEEEFGAWKSVALALAKELNLQEIEEFIQSRKVGDNPTENSYQFVKDSGGGAHQKLSCRYYRDLLEKHHRKKGPIDGAVQVDQRAALEYLPSLINLMRHEVSCFDKGVGRAQVDGTTPSVHKKWLRFGVFYDNRSSLFTMSEMKTLQREYRLGKRSWSQNKTGKRLTERLSHCEEKSRTTKFQAVKGKFSEESLRKANQKSLKDQAAIYSSRKMLGMEEGSDEIAIRRLQRTIAEREAILETQMLQLLCNQVAEYKEQVDSSQGVFKMAHVAYLNLGKREVDNGWTHFENNEVLDMNWAFEQFKGKTLVFDGQGPFVDGETVHLPFKKQDISGEPIRLKLDCRLFNISVQGGGLDQGVFGNIRGFFTGDGLAGNEELRDLQRSINEGKFTGAGQDPNSQAEFDRLKARVENGESRFKLAVDLTHTLVKHGFATSGSCQSSKDRAGLTLGLTAQRFIEESVQASDMDEEDKEYVARSLTIPPLGRHQLPVEIAHNDIGEGALKVSPLPLPNHKQFFWVEGGVVWRVFHLVNSMCFAKTT